MPDVPINIEVPVFMGDPAHREPKQPTLRSAEYAGAGRYLDSKSSMIHSPKKLVARGITHDPDMVVEPG